jgi:hypothetical protein
MTHFPGKVGTSAGDGAVNCDANETLVSVFCPNGGAHLLAGADQSFDGYLDAGGPITTIHDRTRSSDPAET